MAEFRGFIKDENDETLAVVAYQNARTMIANVAGIVAVPEPRVMHLTEAAFKIRHGHDFEPLKALSFVHRDAYDLNEVLPKAEPKLLAAAPKLLPKF
jgi:hypothetical protein